ncbi:MAG: Gx transporter family protein, partial [Clostridia bacterium]|nr:Gx transporter family protein [Clostridia bacterium]
MELQLPPLTAIPGVKLGLANIITLAAVFLLGPVDAAAIMLVRILLGCTLSGQFSALIYSLSG